MTIDRLGEGMILVTLLHDDMTRYSLDFNESADGERTRRGLTRLMYRVGEECGLDHRDKCYLIEALPAKESCLLIISVRSNTVRRRYRIKRENRVDCCRFLTIDDMLLWMSRPESDRIGYALYAVSGSWYLLPEYPLSAAERAVLNEYGAVSRESPVAAARIREHGKLLREHTRRRYFRYTSRAAI